VVLLFIHRTETPPDSFCEISGMSTAMKIVFATTRQAYYEKVENGRELDKAAFLLWTASEKVEGLAVEMEKESKFSVS